MKKRVWILLGLISYGLRFTLSTQPTMRCNRSERSIQDEIRRHKIAVIYVDYNQEACAAMKGGRRSRVWRSPAQRTTLEQSFQALSQSRCYPKGAVTFLRINKATEAGRIFLEDTDLSTVAVPGIVLFSDGVALQDQNGPVVFTGPIHRRELKKKIDSYIDLDIASYVEQERVCKRYERIMQDRMHVYYSPYFSSVANPWNGYWGWPYYGMAQGNYGGNAGVVMGNGGMSFFGSNY